MPRQTGRLSQYDREDPTGAAADLLGKINVITWRGMMTKLMLAVYEVEGASRGRADGWELNAMVVDVSPCLHLVILQQADPIHRHRAHSTSRRPSRLPRLQRRPRPSRPTSFSRTTATPSKRFPPWRHPLRQPRRRSRRPTPTCSGAASSRRTSAASAPSLVARLTASFRPPRWRTSPQTTLSSSRPTS